jgi:Protein of unknown function (DUF2914)
MGACLARRVRGLPLTALASRGGLGYRIEAVKKKAALVASAALLLIACDDPAPTPAPVASAATSTSTSSSPPAIASAAARPSATAAATGAAATPSLQVLRLTLTSEVKQKEPVDELKEAGPGQRVWAHLALRNRSPDARRVSVTFKVDGEERSTVDLQVASSWSFRTWAYNTLRAGDKSGELTVEVRDDAGAGIGQARLPIKATAAKKAAPTK